MAQSPTERVTAVGKIVDILYTRHEMMAINVDKIEAQSKELTKEVAELRLEIALLKREVGELNKWKEEVKKAELEWGRKMWMIVPPVAAVVVSNILTILIMAYFKR